MHIRSFFFFQAEDGIRDIGVTGVQTCALPIFHVRREAPQAALASRGEARLAAARAARGRVDDRPRAGAARRGPGVREIGRASCGGRGEISEVAVFLKKKNTLE